MTFNEDWEREAANWIAWAREPGFDAYWDWSPGFFEEIVPAPGRATLEIGCGEGRVCRDLAERGHHVTGVDASPTLLDAARAAHPEAEYLLADAGSLPFPDESFDVVVAYNSLMDVPDLPRAVLEAGRVLELGGHFCVCVVHPLADAGAFDSPDLDAPFRITGSYFGRRRFEGAFQRGGLTMTFHGWCYPLEDYTRALEEAGFLIESLREPPAPYESQWQRVPNFLFLRAVKRN